MQSNPGDVPPAALVCRNLVKHYGTVRAGDGLNREVRAGECSGLFGPNGARKTATIEIMTLAALAIGRVLGGPDPDERTTLAITCSSRFPGWRCWRRPTSQKATRYRSSWRMS